MKAKNIRMLRSEYIAQKARGTKSVDTDSDLHHIRFLKT
jgi:hypothetical protein